MLHRLGQNMPSGWPEYKDVNGYLWRLDDEDYWWLSNGHNLWKRAESLTSREISDVPTPHVHSKAALRSAMNQKRLQEDQERLWMCPGPGWQAPVTFASGAPEAAWRAVSTYIEQQITSAFSVPSHGLGSGSGGGSANPSLDMCTERNPCPVHLHIGWPSKHTLPRVPLSGQNECNGENSCPARSHSASCAVTAALADTISTAGSAVTAAPMAVQEPPDIPPDFTEIPLGPGCCAECHLDDTPLYEGNRCRYCWMLYALPKRILEPQPKPSLRAQARYVVSDGAFVGILVGLLILILMVMSR